MILAVIGKIFELYQAVAVTSPEHMHVDDDDYGWEEGSGDADGDRASVDSDTELQIMMKSQGFFGDYSKPNASTAARFEKTLFYKELSSAVHIPGVTVSEV